MNQLLSDKALGIEKCYYCDRRMKKGLTCEASFDVSRCRFPTPKAWSLFLDDERFPPNDGRNWKIARTSQDALVMCCTLGAPEHASFDHDLGENTETGFQFVKSFCYLDQEKRIDIPSEFTFYVHSQNPVGAENIRQYLSQYLRIRP